MVAPILISAGRFATTPWGRTIIMTGAGTVGGLLGGLMLGGKKGAAATATGEQRLAQDVTTTTTTVTKNISNQIDRSVQYIVSSPGAVIESKKDMKQETAATVTPSITAAPTARQAMEQRAAATAGMDMTMLALIGGGALIAYGYVTKD